MPKRSKKTLKNYPINHKKAMRLSKSLKLNDDILYVTKILLKKLGLICLSV